MNLYHFFSRPFNEIFKFLQNSSYDFYQNKHNHSKPKGAPACAMASKWYEWDLRKIARICPKMTRKQPFLEFFKFSQKLHTIRTKIYSHSTPY